MEVCPYCFERMHRTLIEEHKNLVHRDIMDAESIVKGPTEHEKKGLLAMGVWLGLEVLFVIILYALEVESNLPWVLVVAGAFIGMGMIGLAIQLSTPIQVKEARKKARGIILRRMVRCDVCEKMIPYEDYSGHVRQLHTRKMLYDWYRTTLAVLLLVVGGGGYMAFSLLAEAEMLPDEQGVLLVIGWIGGSCLIFLCMIYEYYVGELRHIQRMRRHWEEHRYDSRDSENE